MLNTGGEDGTAGNKDNSGGAGSEKPQQPLTPSSIAAGSAKVSAQENKRDMGLGPTLFVVGKWRQADNAKHVPNLLKGNGSILQE